MLTVKLEEPTLPCPRCEGTGRLPNPAAIGQAMRLRRDQLNISLRELARRTGWSPAYVSDLELGKRGWPERTRTRYEAALHT